MVLGHWIPVQFSYEEIFWTSLKSYGYWEKKDINESRGTTAVWAADSHPSLL